MNNKKKGQGGRLYKAGQMMDSRKNLKNAIVFHKHD